MLTPQELIEKATVTTAALADAGKLNPEQANQFIDYVLDETGVNQLGPRVVKFLNEKMLIEKINVASRVAVPSIEATDTRIRRGVSTSKVELQPKDITVPFEIGDLFKDYNIEGDNVEDHIIKMMATRLANNMEQLYWDGSTVGPAAIEGDLIDGGSDTLYIKDSYLALFNGWLKQAMSGHVVDAENESLGPTLVSRALRAMPNKFRKDRKALKALLSWNHEQQYREGVSTRATAAGDAALAAQGNIPSFGIELFPLSLLDPDPLYVEHVVVNADGVTPTALAHKPVTEIVVTPSTLGAAPTAKYVLGVDYSQSLADGTITRLVGGAIGAGATVKVTYHTAGKLLLTMPKNMILAIGRDISIERDRNIYGRVNEFAIHARVYCCFEETDAVVLVKNIKVPT